MYSKPLSGKGFTLLEFVTVVVILGILATIAVATWPGDTLSLNALTKQVARDIQYTQALSINTNTRFCRINFSVNSYSISNAGNTNNPPIWPGSIPLGQGITMSSSQSFIVFDSLGTPYSDASFTTPIASNVTITLTAPSGSTQTITVSPQTGHVSL